MKQFLVGVAALFVFTVGCKKGDSNGSPASTNNWKLGATSYTTGVTEAGLYGTDKYIVEAISSTSYPLDAIEFIFAGTSAPSAGTYKVVSGMSPLTTDQVLVEAGGQSGPSNQYLRLQINW
jgi:hypothetical protein